MTSTTESTPQLNLEGLREGIGVARRRLEPHGVRTPLVGARCLESELPATSFKYEHVQRTGSFKLRGALNKILALDEGQRARGVVTSSSGNHGIAVAESLRLAGGRGTVIVSTAASAYKVERLRRAGLQVIMRDGDPVEAELAARALAEHTDTTYVSPYNDWDVIAGQGTVGAELLEQLPDIEVVYIAVGGGGLISGVATALKAAKPGVRVVGCWPANAPAMYESLRAGRIFDVQESPTLSDGTAGNVEPGAITFELCRALIDEHVLVSEAEIARAMRDVLLVDHQVIEGAAGVAVAAARTLARTRPEYASLTGAVVLCGGNVSAETLVRILESPTSSHGT
jgi:threonine dehydratase